MVQRFVQERFGLLLSRSSCLNYLHRLGFVLKQPKKHFLKADDGKREAFLAVYAAFLKHLREKHAGPLNVIWDNAPAHHGDALRAYLTTPG